MLSSGHAVATSHTKSLKLGLAAQEKARSSVNSPICSINWMQWVTKRGEGVGYLRKVGGRYNQVTLFTCIGQSKNK